MSADRLISDPIPKHAERFPEKTAVECAGKRCSYATLYRKVKQTARLLERSTHRLRPKIGIGLPNGIDFIALFLGAAAAGWTAVPLNPAWGKKEWNGWLAEYDFDAVVCEQPVADHFGKGTQAYTTEEFWRAAERDVEDAVRTVSLDDRTHFYMGFTSGTTGIPKAYVRTHRSWVKSFLSGRIEFGIDYRDIVYVPGPLFHSFSLYAAVHALYEGATVRLERSFSAAEALRTLQRGEVTAAYMVPTMLEAVWRKRAVSPSPRAFHPAVKKMITSGAKWRAESKRKMKEMLAETKLYEFYGASELSFVSLLDPEGNCEKPESVGRPFAGVEVSIRREDGSEARAGEIGKLYVKSGMLFDGYVGRPKETRRVLRGDGWATVDDLGYRDADGFLYLVGREKNMLISGGLNVYPEEVENVLLQMPGVREAVVIGADDAYWGDKIVAYLKLDEGAEENEQEWQTFCRRHLDAYKCPKAFYVVSQFPYTSSGKIDRRAMKKRYGGREA